jgi:isoamylase
VRTAHVRERTKRNFLATLAFSQGVPMLSHGDELGRSQAGNNNAYCHDSPLTWVNWQLTPQQRELLRFTRGVFAIRAANPELRRSSFFRREATPQEQDKDLTWLQADGKEVSAEEWKDAGNHLLGMLIRGDNGGALLLLLNAGGRSRPFTLPVLRQPGTWTEVVNTHHPGPVALRESSVNLGARSLILLRCEPQ